MKRRTTKSELNCHTQEFLLEKCGLSVTEGEAEEIRQSLAQYCRLLIEISENQPEEEYAHSLQAY